MNTQLEFYMMWMEHHNRNATSRTTIRSVLGKCLSLLEGDGRPTDALAIRPDDFYWLASELMHTGSESRAKQYIGMLSTYCKRHGGTDASRLGLMWNSIQTHPTRITVDDFRTMYDKAEDCDRLILALGGSMGLRREEIARIRVEDVLEDGIIIHGKGHGAEGKVAVQPMSEMVRRELCMYMYKTKRGRGQYLVVWPGTHEDSSIQARCAAIGRRVASMSILIGKRVTPHALRRLFATTLDRQGVPINLICDLMRHTNPSTTKIYIARDEGKLREAVTNLSEELSALVI